MTKDSKNTEVAQVNWQKAVDAIANATKNNPVILDFDETLLLRNSTAEYINNLRPRLLGWIVIILLKIVKPWVWLPQPFRGDKTKDWFLVIVPTILLPWTLLLWQHKAQKLAEDYGNPELISAVNSNPAARIIIASLGFNFIINPILQQLPMRSDLLVSCRFWHPGDRHQGKLLMMQQVLSEKELESAIVVTDSEDDLPLLQVVGEPFFVIWSQAKYVKPFKDFWLYTWLKRIRNKQ